VGPLSPSDPPIISRPAPGPPLGNIDADRTNAPKKRRLRWPGIVFPLLFLLLAGIVVYLVLDLTGVVNTTSTDKPQPDLVASPDPQPTDSYSGTTPVSLSTDGPRRPLSNTEKAARLTEQDLDPDGGLPPTPQIDLHSPLPSSPSARITSDPNNPSNILEKFLLARTLEERLPYMSESKYSKAELATSALAIPLPEIVNRRSIHYMENKRDRHKEHFYEVSFQMEPNQLPVSILVQLNDWGDGNVKVHTDAFLDLFDGHLASFAKTPVPGEQTFHVVADAFKHCFDEIIPNHEKRSVLKLRAHPRAAPTVVAYFNRASSISDQISESDWGEVGICTVTVEWNTSVGHEPFVELRRIEGFTWNP
jgi:hypothetical protein